MEYRLHTKDKTSTQKLGRYIKAIEITPIKLSKNAGYKYQKSSKELYDIFKAKKWIDEEVDLINPENPNKKPSDEEDNFKSKYENLLKQHEELKKQLQQLQEPKATKQPKNVVINEIKESKETSINSLLSITNDADAMDEMINAML